uniref:RNA polymerase beta subunit n=1 Tax=Gonyostomum semen TaxID=375454 RepID=UPI0021155472|nr:RNA polymerase beta subunit [Gonyostomum semen]UTE94378.1 RNA polymerase beta subunit [Gonyostomum semen]
MTNKYFPTNLPNFLEIQRCSFYWFLIYGLSDQLSLFPSIIDLNTEIEVRFYVNEFVFKKKRAKTLLDYKQNNLTYGIKIFLPIYIKNPNTNERKRKQNIFIGQLPLMTNNGSFIINGCERVVVSQIIKCPGLYYKIQIIKNQVVSTITLASQRGSWLQFEFNDSGCWVRVDKNQKVCILDFLYGIGLNDQEIMFGLKSEYILYKYKNYQEQLKSSDERDQFLPDEDLEFICSRLFNIKYYELGKVGRLRLNKRLNLNIATNVKTITHQDILAILDYFLTLKSFLSDDFDDLRNKSIRSVGEILENQFRIGLNRFKRNIAETITIYQEFDLTISNLINPRPLIASIKEFFGTSQLSQYLDQTNPLAELSHKRRISALGPGGLNIDRITLAARDIHPTQYGRICPIETPEGKNVGLVGGLASYAKVNSNGFIETPYFQVKHGQILYNKPLVYLSANEEENVKIAAADVKRNKKGFLTDEFIVARFNQEFIMASTKDIDFVSISPLQITSIAASLIPFLEHDDGNRALMGANMQRQAVPLLYPQKPIVGTGLELKIVADSLFVVLAVKSGIVKFVSSEKIIIKNFEGTEISYLLKKYQRSNQNTCINQKPLVWVGEEIKIGQIIADGPATDIGELALGQNLTVAYMPWEGYNYEDAILINEKLVYENLFTSIHIEKYETEIRQTKTGPEMITRDIPFVNNKNILYLDENGIICKGALVQPDDILVGKVTPKTEVDQLPEARLLKAIFGYKTPNVRDTSLRVPIGIFGRVLDIKVFQRENTLKFSYVNSLIRVFIAQIRKIKVGDKISGRHGNKGIISKILPSQDMPFLPDGTIVDLILNPLGVPSRMNVGQIYESLLGFAGDHLNKSYKILPFDEMYQSEASRVLINQKLRQASKKQNKPWLYSSYSPGKILLSDGRTGEKFDNPILVGRSYILKLIHLVDDKIHARSTGPYSLITQQPVRGRSKLGGQRFGEMEVWALEAYGSAYTLQELLTIKSDDIQSRNEVLNSIVCGQQIPKSGIPESFKVLITELQALGLNIKTYKLNKTKSNEITSIKIDLMKTYETIFNEYLFN